MNPADIVTAVMQEIQDLRENDRGTGQDSRWNRLDAIPNAVHQALQKHGGQITHEVLSLHQSTRADKKGSSRNYVQGVVRFNILGSDSGEPVTGEVPAGASDRGDPIPKMMKSALRTFLIQLFVLPTDRAEPDLHAHELVQNPALPSVSKSKARTPSRLTGLPWSPMTIEVAAQKAGLSLDEYAVESAKYYIEALSISRDPIFRLELVERLIFDGFSQLQAEYGVAQALLGFGLDGNTSGELGMSLG
jgi:hypothetical protein